VDIAVGHQDAVPQQGGLSHARSLP
jgi:hypothetical protein